MSQIVSIFMVFITPVLAILLAVLGLETLRSNPLGWFLLLVGVVYTAGVAIVVGIRKERFWESSLSGATLQEERGDRSYWLIMVGMMAAFYLPPIEYLAFEAILPRAISLEILGLGLVILGVALLIWARRALGGSYSGHLTVKEEQELVQRGPYRFLRHPAYAGYLLMAAGLSLGYSSLGGLAAIAILLLPCLIYRIKAEEKIMVEQYGETYRVYIHTTKGLIPGIW